MPRLIGFTGFAGSGKSTAAAYLRDSHGYELVKFADGLKDMLRALGASEAEIEGDLKEKPSALFCGQTPRYVMQTLGTEWGRDLIHPGFWTHLWKLKVSKLLSLGRCVVCDDVRFPNEYETFHDLQGELWFVDRGFDSTSTHESEQHIKFFSKRNIPHITNYEMKDALYEKLYDLI